MSKLYRARSLLYRHQILQENIRWTALDEIYKIYMLLHRSDPNISAKFRQTCWRFQMLEMLKRLHFLPPPSHLGKSLLLRLVLAREEKLPLLPLLLQAVGPAGDPHVPVCERL